MVLMMTIISRSQFADVRTGTDKVPKVRTSTYEYVLCSVYHGHGSTCKILSQYMTVHCSTISSHGLSLFMAVHGGTLQYMTRFAPGGRGGAAHFGAHLKALHCMLIQ